MEIIEELVSRLKLILDEQPQKFLAIPKDVISFKLRPEKWSKKEILGHLCDSAINNISRFIRAQYEAEPFQMRDYNQDKWVQFGDYQSQSIEEVVRFWVIMNERIVQIISKLTEETLSKECDLQGATFKYCKAESNTLLWLVADYVAHMDYHLKQIV